MRILKNHSLSNLLNLYLEAGVLGCRSFSTTRNCMIKDESSASNTDSKSPSSNTDDQPSTSNMIEETVSDEEESYRIERKNTTVSELDPDVIPDAYHETREDLANADTEEERAKLQDRLDRLNSRINDEGLEDSFEGYPPRHYDDDPEAMRRMNTEPENMEHQDYVMAASQLEDRMNEESNPRIRAQLQEQVNRIYEEAERNDLTGL